MTSKNKNDHIEPEKENNSTNEEVGQKEQADTTDSSSTVKQESTSQHSEPNTEQPDLKRSKVSAALNWVLLLLSYPCYLAGV